MSENQDRGSNPNAYTAPVEKGEFQFSSRLEPPQPKAPERPKKHGAAPLIAAVLISLFVSNFLDLGLWKGIAAESLAVLKWKQLLLGAAVFAGTKIWKKAHPAVFLAFGAVTGIVLQL